MEHFEMVPEKGVVVPTRSILSGYDWSQWDIGDSALIPKSKRQTVLKAGQAYLGEMGMNDRKFITRVMSDDEVRVWLVKAD